MTRRQDVSGVPIDPVIRTTEQKRSIADDASVCIIYCPDAFEVGGDIGRKLSTPRSTIILGSQHGSISSVSLAYQPSTSTVQECCSRHVEQLRANFQGFGVQGGLPCFAIIDGEQGIIRTNDQDA